MEDKRDILRSKEPFSYREIKNEKIQINFNGKLIKTLQGKEYIKFRKIKDLQNPFELQLFIAKITGQFKHGNEKDIKS